ncbi:MAG TPA: hypothetical protein VJR89_34520 [Polyangiales bacterium]|nr:hypothetical protein [Polyangiales bacterium]
MTTDRDITRSWAWGVALFAALAGACAGMSAVRSGDTIDTSGYPKDIQAAYEVFAVRCSRCHTLARPLNARIRDPEHWVRYVTRMRRNPTSGINPKDAEIILRFLLYYTAQVAAEEDAASGASTAPSAPPPEPSSHAVPNTPTVVPAPAPGTPTKPPAQPDSMTDPVSDPNVGRTP